MDDQAADVLTALQVLVALVDVIRQVEVIQKHWAEAADLARLTESQRNYLWHRQVLNPYASYGYAQNGS